MRGTLIVSADVDSLYDVAAEKIGGVLETATAGQKVVRIALAGGHTPRPLYERLAGEPWRTRILWAKLHVFWGDERLVPHDHPDSNYRTAYESLLARVPIPPSNVHGVPTGAGLREAPQSYEEELRAHFRARKGIPVFDVVLLGVGADGHVASLFPHSPAVHNVDRLVVGARSQSGMARITLTLPVLNQARHIFVLATGKEKAEVIQRGIEEPGRLPVQRITPVAGDLTWLLDQAAARTLSKVQVGG